MNEALRIMVRGAMDYLNKEGKTELANSSEFNQFLKAKFKEVIAEIRENKEIYLPSPQFRALANDLLAVALYQKGIEAGKLLAQKTSKGDELAKGFKTQEGGHEQ